MTCKCVSQTQSSAKYTAATGSSLCFDVGRVGSLRWLHFHPLWVTGGGSVIFSRKRGAGWMTHIFFSKLLELNRGWLMQFRLFFLFVCMFWFFFINFCLQYEAKSQRLLSLSQCKLLQSPTLDVLCHYSSRPLQSISRISLHILTVKLSKFTVNAFSCATMKSY